MVAIDSSDCPDYHDCVFRVTEMVSSEVEETRVNLFVEIQEMVSETPIDDFGNCAYVVNVVDIITFRVLFPTEDLMNLVCKVTSNVSLFLDLSSNSVYTGVLNGVGGNVPLVVSKNHDLSYNVADDDVSDAVFLNVTITFYITIIDNLNFS